MQGSQKVQLRRRGETDSRPIGESQPGGSLWLFCADLCRAWFGVRAVARHFRLNSGLTQRRWAKKAMHLAYLRFICARLKACQEIDTGQITATAWATLSTSASDNEWWTGMENMSSEARSEFGHLLPA